jgi:hypothetical protein
VAAAICIRRVSGVGLDAALPALVALLRESADGGPALRGVLDPLDVEEARRYWLAVRTGIEAGRRILLTAYRGGRLVGAVQVALVPGGRGARRAELRTLLVATAALGSEVGSVLVDAACLTAHAHGLLVAVSDEEVVGDDVAHEVGLGDQPELLEEARPVRADRLHAQPEPCGDLLHHQPAA